MFARIASWRIKRAKSSLISFSDIVISLCINSFRGWARTSSARQQHVFQYCPLLHHVELHDTPSIYSIIQAAGSHTSLRHTTQSPSALLDLQSGFLISIRFACCCVTATIQPSIPTTSLGLILLPICSVCYCVTATVTHQPVVLSDSEITAHACFLFYGRTHSPLSCCLFPRHP